ncbi:peptidoglycan recognition family protein [Galbibacter sp. EGI 63066]|nr:peptidoglycan recognition family protein [Galbibacter sp. EGI 63066]MCX2679538.1 peptidoglycan recognition family protein [Galbibacter sp. EGI 63066]
MLCILLTGCAPAIVDEPIVFDDERKELTLTYLNERYGLNVEEPTIEPKMVVVHWTAIPTFQKSFDAFYEPTLPDSREAISGAGALNVSSQFLIDRDGIIYRLMPETTMARHVIGLNHCAIGIENVGGTEETPLTDAQLKANIKLIKYLDKKYAIDYVIGHYEYRLFEGHRLWLEKDNGYRTDKVDPGRYFISEIRKSLKRLDLKPMPVNSLGASSQSIE